MLSDYLPNSLSSQQDAPQIPPTHPAACFRQFAPLCKGMLVELKDHLEEKKLEPFSIMILCLSTQLPWLPKLAGMHG